MLGGADGGLDVDVAAGALGDPVLLENHVAEDPVEPGIEAGSLPAELPIPSSARAIVSLTASSAEASSGSRRRA